MAHTTLTYGILPSRDQFDVAFEIICGNETFAVRNDAYLGNASFTPTELYDQLLSCVDEYCDDECDEGDDAGNFASDALSVLGFEWI